MDIEEGEIVTSEEALQESLRLFDTVRVETETLPPLIELGRRLLLKAQEGDAVAVKDLMSQGAPFTTDWLGTSPLHWACQLNHVDVVEVLLKAGISRDGKNKVDRTPLHAASQEGNIEVVKLLLKYGVDVDALDMLQMSALHWAAEYGHDEVVRLLLDNGIDPCAVNKFDKTADQISFDNNRLDITQLIQEYAESPLKAVRRKEAKEKHKLAAAAFKAAAELERLNHNNINRANCTSMRVISNGEKVLKQTNDGIRVLKISPGKLRPTNSCSPSNLTKVVFENNLRFTNNSTPAPNLKVNPTEDTTEKTLAMLQAHGITMLPNDDSTIVESAVQSGQKIVLTEAGKMALNQTESPVIVKNSPLPVKKLIKLPPGAVLKGMQGKKLIKIHPDQLLKMKTENKVVIQTDKTFKPSIFANSQVVDKNKATKEVVVKKILLNNKQLLTSTVVDKSEEYNDVESIADNRVPVNGPEKVIRIEEETEMEKIKRELEETKKQVELLREQYLRKEKEADEYKKLIDLLRGEK